MAFDSDEKRSDFEAWVEEMSYEEEKELKRQQKEQKKKAHENRCPEPKAPPRKRHSSRG